MKRYLGCGGLVLLVVAAVVIAIPVACVATVAVPMLDHAMLESIMCPPGTKLQTTEIQNYNDTGPDASPTHTSVYCVDAEGQILDTRDVGYGALAYFPKYLAISASGLVILAVLFWAAIAGVYLLLKLRRRTAGPLG
jgi:hypothetical protein